MRFILYILSLGVFFVILFWLLAIAWYIFSALGIYTLAKNNGYKDKAFLAFIPFVNNYVLALLAGDVDVFGVFLASNTLGLALVFLPFLTNIRYIGWILSLLYVVVKFTAIYNLYKKLDEDNALIMTILSIFPIVAAIYLFIKKDTIFNNTTTVEKY